MKGIIHAFVLDGRGGGLAVDWDAIERWTPDAGPLWVHLDYEDSVTQSWLGLRSWTPN